MAQFRHMEHTRTVERIYAGAGLAVERVRYVDQAALSPEQEHWGQWSFRIMRGGTRYVSYGDRACTLAPNTVLWHGPLPHPVNLRALPCSRGDQIVVRLSARRWTAWLAQHTLFRDRHAASLTEPPVFERGSAPPQVLIVIRDLLALHNRLRRSTSVMERQCTRLLRLIAELHFGREPGVVALERQQRVEAAQAILAGDLEQPPSLGQLAEMLSVSPRQLQRDFIACAGLTPRGYLNLIRLSEANTLLAETSLPVATIAARLGYVSQTHFSTAFKALYHCSPREFRALLQGRAGHDEPHMESSLQGCEENSP